MKKIFGFTLAEVLITLGIIGVVAALTIPSLISKYQEQQYINSLKVAYSTLDQAVHMAVNEYGTVDQWNVQRDAQGGAIIVDNLLPFIKSVKLCQRSSRGTNKCFATSYKGLDGSDFLQNQTPGKSFNLPNGISFHVYSLYSGCNTDSRSLCAYIITDINGQKGPNVLGKDTFYFVLLRDKISPIGKKRVQDIQYSDCYPFESNCLTGDGIGCAAWVLFNGNMDYLHCDDLSWDGKTKCK